MGHSATPLSESRALSEASEIRQQLSRVLESSWFRSSSRCSQLLRHVVELAIEGEVDRLKERQIAVEAFHRKPSYDNYSDPVVRVVAGEVRKRLAQYYGDPENTNQLRIELPVGSYVPAFHLHQPDLHLEANTLGATELDQSADPEAQNTKIPLKLKLAQLRIWWASAAVLVLLLLTAAAWRAIKPAPKPSAFDNFWAPMLSTEHPPLISIGELRASELTFVPDIHRSHISGNFTIQLNKDFAGGAPVAPIAQSEALAKIASVLGAKKTSFDVRRQSETTFGDILGRPVIVLGSYDNDWAMGINEQIGARFTLQSDPARNSWWIADRNKPSQRIGEFNFSSNEPASYDAFSLITRRIGAFSRQPHMIIAGFGEKGTVAAADFISKPRYLNEFAQRAPKGWENRNIEFLIQTHIVENVPGIPVIVDYSVW